MQAIENKAMGVRQAVAWGLVAMVNVLAVVAWGQSFNWQFGLLNIYLIFPLLGLIAFSTMWCHYAIGFLNEVSHQQYDGKLYFTVTGWVVLVAICLHPGLLIFQRFQDGYGLPPGSYESYVAPSLRWVTLLGTASLLVFLAFELRRKYRARRWWKYVLYLNDVAMLAVFYHGLRLGNQLQTGWYPALWYALGLSLVFFLGFKYARLTRTWAASRR